MKRTRLLSVAFVFVWLFQSASFAQSKSEPKIVSVPFPVAQTVKVSPQTTDDFHWDYYLYIPRSLFESPEKPSANHLLVMPNNTGTSDDDIRVHDNYAKNDVDDYRKTAEQLKVVLLEPVFPRARTNERWKLYTHALDRDTLLTTDEKLRRLDLQLTAMIDDARRKLSNNNLQVDEKVLMFGFSASAMFVNRFCLLHPKRVLAAAIGSPGGWAMLPVKSWNKKPLRYPLGINDLKKVAGRKFDSRTFKTLPLYFFVGDRDTNDSLTFRDGYDEQDERLIFDNFGSSLVGRLQIAERAYQKAGCVHCQFVIYKGIGHETNRAVWTDVNAFFIGELNRHRRAAEQIVGREGETATFLTSQKRSLLKLQKMADFYYIPKAKIGWSFETLIMG